jgi:hypothetical protein
MSQIHEPGDAWHIGWDWHAGMWFVEPPFSVDLDEPMLWFNERHEAFEKVDEFIREQPVRASVVDEIPAPPVDLTVIRHEDNPFIPRYVPKVLRDGEPERVISEPKRVVANNAAAQDRVSDYASRVGLG